jgi:PAS domain S-box-containing protein
MRIALRAATGERTHGAVFALMHSMGRRYDKNEANQHEQAQQTLLILESIPTAYLSVDQHWCCVYLNRAMEQLMRMRREDMLGRDVRALFAGTDAARDLPFYAQAMEQRAVVTFESFYPSYGIWTEGQIFPNELNGITISQRDISAQKQTEQQLHEREELLDLLNENLRDHALIIMDANGMVLDWNIGAQRMFGFTAEEMRGQFFGRIFTLEDQAAGVPERELATARATGRAADERWQQRRDGSLLWASGSTTALRDEQGQLRGFVKLARDDTRRIQITAALERSEARLRMALKAAAMGTWELDVATSMVHWDTQHYQLFGLPAEQQAQPLAFFFQHVHPDDREQMQHIVERMLQGAANGTFHHEYRVVWPDGSVHWLMSEGSVQRDEAGQPINITGVSTDITERKATEAALRQYRAGLEQRVTERTAELAHANQKLQAEIVERQRAEDMRKELMLQLMTLQESERHRIARELHDQMGQQLVALSLRLKALEDALHNSDFALQSLRLIRDMADQLGQDIHRLALDLRPTALDDLGLLTAMRMLAEQWSAQAHVVVDFHSANIDDRRIPPPIATAIYRVVQEALTNIVKHAHASRVSLIVEDGDDTIAVIIEDDGTGFDTEAAQMPHTNRMGLQSMRERIALIGGTLTIESSPGSGTTVFVRVPLAQHTEGSS